MSAVLDALATSLTLGIIAWIAIMVPTSAALAYRLGWKPGYGALLGLVPIPFLGWLLVWIVAEKSGIAGRDLAAQLSAQLDSIATSTSETTPTSWDL